MIIRPRRLRRSPALRSLLRETTVTPASLVYPMFVSEAEHEPKPVTSMPGVVQWPVALVAEEAASVAALGIPGVLLFGIPRRKDAFGSESFAPEGVVQQAVRRIKDRAPDLAVITDVCLCEYTDHGHCGLLSGRGPTHPHLPDGYLLNDETLDVLARIAVSHATAGADVIAPSGMIDGAVARIRRALDEARFEHTPILSYSAKYASVFYGPFRDAAQGAPRFGDRSSHQMDPANSREALRECELDVQEGADMLMIKPALAYLDVIRMVRDRFPQMPLAAYNVSGEYAMLKAAAANGWLDERRSVLEVMTAIHRAGADVILTYHAKDVATWLEGGG